MMKTVFLPMTRILCWVDSLSCKVFVMVIRRYNPKDLQAESPLVS